MARVHFGTDGVRGVANSKLTPEFAQALGAAVGVWIRENQKHPEVIIGRDTRRSGPMLGAALASGLCSAGVNVTAIGVAPTPTVAYLARTGHFEFGGIISASHNPAPDNGIKFVGSDGNKSSDALEETWEGILTEVQEQLAKVRGVGGDVGYLSTPANALEPYLNFLCSLVPEGLRGLKVAVDAANGAAYQIGPEVLRRLGAEVVAIGIEPDGMNINEFGGATKPQTIQDYTVSSGAHVGVAFDGDADRCVFSDEKGRLINGDRTIGIWAAHQQKIGKLSPAVAVGTVMSNGGFESYLTSLGIKLERTPVGDKYVSQRIRETNARIGGEQSGHIIFPEHQPTGDGLVTMLEVLKALKEEGRPSSAFYDDYEPWPQLMVNVGVERKDGWQDLIAEESAIAESKIAGHGRIVTRPSGTQPMIRVMVEADDWALRDEVTEILVGALERKLGGHIHGRVDLTYALGD